MRKIRKILVGKVSFDADSNHRLQDSVKVSLDLIVDQANELYASLPGAGSSKEYPFVQINIKHLNLQDGTGENLLPVDKHNYKSDFQVNVNETISLQGLNLASGLAPAHISDIIVNASARLDLDNAESNNTELYAAIILKHDHLDAKDNYNFGSDGQPSLSNSGIPLELSYKNGTLNLKADTNACLLDVPGVDAAHLPAWNLLLGKPVGNLIDSILPADQKAAFDQVFWTTVPNPDAEENKDGVLNNDFQGLTINKLDVKTIIDMIGKAINKSENTQENPAETSAEEAKSSYYNVIGYAVTLLSSKENGIVELASTDGILGTVVKIAKYAGLGQLTTTDKETQNVTTYDWTKEGFTNWAAKYIDDLLKGFTGGMIGGAAVLVFDGVNANQDFADILGDVLDEIPNAIDIKFDFTKGFDWDINIMLQEDPEVSLTWTSRIGITDYIGIQDVTDYYVEYNEMLQKAAELAQAATDATAAKTAANTLWTKEADYTTYTSANSAYTSAKNSYRDLPANLSAVADLMKEKFASTALTQKAITGNAALYEYFEAKYDLEKDANNAELQKLVEAKFEGAKAVFGPRAAVGGGTEPAIKDGKTDADIIALINDVLYASYKEKAGAAYDEYKWAIAARDKNVNYQASENAVAAETLAKNNQKAIEAKLKIWKEYAGTEFYEKAIKALKGAAAMATYLRGRVTTFVANEMTKDDYLAKLDAYLEAKVAYWLFYETGYVVDDPSDWMTTPESQSKAKQKAFYTAATNLAIASSRLSSETQAKIAEIFNDLELAYCCKAEEIEDEGAKLQEGLESASAYWFTCDFKAE